MRGLMNHRMPRRAAPSRIMSREQVAEVGLVHAELTLHGQRGQAHLVAGARHPALPSTLHLVQLDAIGVLGPQVRCGAVSG